MADTQFAGIDDAVAGVMQQERGATALQIRNNVQSSAGQNADQAAQYQHLAKFVGVPVETVEQNPDLVKSQAAAQRMDADALADQTPHVAKYLTDPSNAAKSHDDIPPLAGMEVATKALPFPANPAPTFGETALEAVKGLGGSFNKAAGSVNMVLGAFPTLYDKAASLITGKPQTDASDAWFRNFVDPAINTQATFEPTRSASFSGKALNMAGNLLGMLSQIALTGPAGEAAPVSSVPELLGQVATHGTKSMAFPAISDSVSTANRVYQETGDAGQAIRAAQMQYGQTTLGGMVPLSAPGNLATRLVGGFASGVATGEISRTGMNMVLPASMQQPFDFESLLLSGMAGSALGGVMGPRSEPDYLQTLRQTYADAAKADASEQGMHALQALGEMATASKTRERDPAAFRQLVQNMTENGNLQDVYISADKLGEVLNQSGVSIAKLAETMPEVAAQLHEATMTNGDVRIPVEDYATHIAGGPVDAALLPNMKVDPDGMTYQEGQDYFATQQEGMKAQADQIVADQQAADSHQAESQAVHDKILDQLNTLKRFNPEVNKSYASLLRAYFDTQAERSGMTPMQMFEMSGLNVKGEALAEGLHQSGKTDEATGLPLNDDGTVTLYHHTSAASAEAIRKSGVLKSKGEPDIYLTTRKETDTGYGDTAVPVKVDPAKLHIDDEFPDGRTDYRMNVGKPGGSVKVKIADELNQANRGSYNPETKTLALLKAADLSTFLHESGHFFLETGMNLAARPAATDAMRGDMGTLLDHFGIQGTPEHSALEQWHAMTLDQKREAHENFAQGFEKYLMEGKAPTLELQSLFSRFRSWLLNVYKSLTGLNVQLTPEVRGVMDRMLASDEAIREAEQTRKYKLVFDTAEAAGVSQQAFNDYEAIGKEATDEAVADMTARSIGVMKWLSNAKSRALKAMQQEAKSKRDAIQLDVTREVMQQPIYQAWQFLTLKGHADTQALPDAKEVSNPKHVDPRKDSLFTAIAKNGGLNRDDVKTHWGVDHRDMPDSGVFGKPILRKSGGLSIERMAERLHEDHYLDAHDLAEFEEKFDAQRGGHEQYSWEHDYQSGERPPVGPMGESNFHGKLDTSMLKHMFGEGADAVWRKLSEQRMTSDKTGLDPDIVSDMVGGFDSGRDMVEQLAAAETPHSAIKRMTDQRMLEQHGELTDAKSIERAAEAAIHNEARAKFMATGLKMLSKSPIPARELAKAAQEAADAAIAAKRIRDIRPAQYTAAEARSNAAALKLAPKDPAGAVQAQRAALLNNRLYKAAIDAVAEINKHLAYLGKFDKASVRDKIDLEYRDQIDALLDRYDLRKSTTNAALDKREALSAFVERMAGMGNEPQIPEKMLNELTRQHYKDMNVEEFRGLVDAVKSIDHMGRMKTQLLDGKEARDLAELANEARDTMAELPQRTAESNRGLTRMESKWLSVKAAGRSLQASLLKMEQMMDWLDNRNPNGVLNRVVFRRIADAGVKEADMQRSVKADIDTLMRDHLQDVTKEKGKIYVADKLIDGETGKPQKLTKKEFLMLLGNLGNESNASKMARGEGWDEAAMWEFADQNASKADWDFVAGMGKTIESLWPEKLEMSRRLGNTNPDKIAPRPFDTQHGRYEGWYWPMIYDPARSQDVADRSAKMGSSMMENTFTRANTDTGRSTTRVEGYARPLLLSLDALPRVIRDEIHDIAYREAIMDAGKFLSNDTVRDSIVSALSQEHYDQLKPWLQSIANDGKLDDSGMRALKWFNNLAHGARTSATIVGLGYRVSTMLVHGASAGLESGTEVGPAWFAKGLADFSNPTQWAANRDFIFERSGEMRNRMNEVDRDIREHLREIDLRLMDTTSGIVVRGADLMKAHAYQGIAMLDMASALPTWMGAYHKGMAPEAQGGLGLSEADAVYFAEKTVRNAHGGGGVKDMAAIQRGNEFMKLFTMFYTFWNHNVNRLMDTARLAQALPETFRNGAPGEFRGDVGTVIMRTLVYTLGVQVMHSMLHPSKDDQGDTNWLAWAGKEFTAAAFAGIPVLRDVSAHFLTGKDYSATPAAQMVSAIGNSGKDAMNAMAGRDVSDKWLKHSLTTTGYVFGLPLGQPASTAQFLWDVGDGHQNPQDISDWWRGIMHGDMKKH